MQRCCDTVWGRLSKGPLCLAVLIWLWVGGLAEGAPETVKIGVLAKRGAEQCLAMWTPTAEYLTRTIPDETFVIVPVDFVDIYESVERGDVDFILANSSFYVELESWYGVNRIATLRNRRLGAAYTKFGGVVFRRADRQELRNFMDLKGGRFMAVKETSFGGWRMAWRELKAVGIDPYADFEALAFGGTHDAVVYAVRDGLVDAGTVRTDTLERMDAEGKIDLDTFTVFPPPRDVSGEIPFTCSTRLYPEWPMAKVGHTSVELAERVATALLNMSHDSPAATAAKCAGWTIPLSYQPVHECLRELKIGPYKDLGKIAFADVFTSYWQYILGSILLFMVMTGGCAVIYRLNRNLGVSKRKLETEMEERGHAQVALEESERRLKTILNSVHAGVVVIDGEDHKIVEVNPVAADLIGLAREEIVGHTCHKFICPAETGQCPVTDLNETVHSSERVLINAAGEHIPILKTVAKMELNGRVHVVDSFIDITQQKEAEAKLRESRNFLKRIMDGMHEGLMVVDRAFTIGEVNAAFLRQHGGQRDEVVGAKCHKITHGCETPCSSDEHQCPAMEVFKTEASVVVEHVHQDQDGNEVLVKLDAFPIFGKDGRVDHVVELSEDVTEKRRAEEALRDSEERFRSITNSALDAIIIMDDEGNIAYWNPAAETIFGYVEEEAMGRDLHRLIASDEFYEPARKRLGAFRVTGGSPGIDHTSERSAVRKDGTIFPIEMSLASVKIKGRWNAIGLVRDITERKRTEAKLVRISKAMRKAAKRANKLKLEAEAANRSKSNFLANMSHEIRTPMNGVIGMTGLLLDTDMTDEQRGYAEVVRNSGESLLTVINDVLDYSKIEAGKLELEALDFDLRSTVEDVTEILALNAHKKDIELTCLVKSDVPTWISGDPGRVRQILTNLVGNAVKFTETGGVHIKVELDGREDEGARIRFSVTDTGIGIPEDRLGVLFQSFSQVDASTTRKYGGTGLGLAISKRLSELMGGQIGVESRDGEGSTFWFTILAQNPSTEPDSRAVTLKGLEGTRILVVDDNAVNRQVLKEQLKTIGCPVDEVSSGADALEALREAADAKSPYEIAILDMHMPGMDGETLGQAIKADEKICDTKLIMLTSLGLRGDAAKAKKIGFAAYLTKPIKWVQLRNCLATVLGQYAPSAGERSDSLVTKHLLTEGERDRVRILVAEDNAVNQKVALRLLEKLGLQAEVVGNGLEAVNALERGSYDIVFMDVQMPEMDGFEATRVIRDPASRVRDHDVPIIAMTAHAMKGDREKCLEAGMDDYVPKPIRPNTLHETLEKYLSTGKDPQVCPD